MSRTSPTKPPTKSARWISKYGNLLMKRTQKSSRARMRLGPHGPFESLVRWLAKGKTERGVRGKNQAGLGVLNEVSNDNTTPRNIRRAAKDAMDALQAVSNTIGVRASNAISILDEIGQDPNMPPYTRVKLWNVASILEAIKD